MTEEVPARMGDFNSSELLTFHSGIYQPLYLNCLKQEALSMRIVMPC